MSHIRCLSKRVARLQIILFLIYCLLECLEACACPKHIAYVCGTDEKTHSNICTLRCTACMTKNKDLKKKHDGECTRSPTGEDAYKVYEEETMVGNFDEFYNFGPERHECDRLCKKGEPEKICKYELHITEYTTMGKVNFGINVI